MRRATLAIALGLTFLGVLPSAGSGEPGRELRVGLVEWTGSATGTALGRQFHSGFVSAVGELGLQASVRAVSPDRSAGEALAYFAQRNYDLVVMGAFSPDMAAVTAQVAQEFPDITFLVPDHKRLRGQRNVQGFVLRVEEASFLAGHLAAQLARSRPGRNTVSAVGGIATPAVVRFIAGFEAGAHRADPRTRTLRSFSGDFNNPRKCQKLALAQISKGSGAVLDVAGACGEGALAAARAKRVWGIGADADYSANGSHILTSVLKHYDVALLRVLRAFARHALPRSGTMSLGLRDGAVGLGKISPRVSPSARRALAEVHRDIATRRIRVPATLR